MNNQVFEYLIDNAENKLKLTRKAFDLFLNDPAHKKLIKGVRKHYNASMRHYVNEIHRLEKEIKALKQSYEIYKQFLK